MATAIKIPLTHTGLIFTLKSPVQWESNQLGMKKCPKCSQEKSLVDFPKDKTRLDGLFPYCKVCVRANNADYYASSEKIREQIRLNAQMYNKNKRKEKYKENKALMNEKLREYRKRPYAALKHRCRSALQYAIRMGKARKRNSCEICHTVPTQCHHDDYKKPFDFVELCKGCHSKLHRKFTV